MRARALQVAVGVALMASPTALAALQGCGASDEHPYDPLAYARAAGPVGNLEAAVPPMCYTRTDGVSNPCWVCHSDGHGRNRLDDGDLQARYDFSDEAKRNHWTNLFVDRRDAIAAVDDATMLAWVRTDNYAPLRQALAGVKARDYPGFRPDLDLARGFDADGFARDDSGWRAVRFQPFAGAFWPTNGSTSDVFVRLPDSFQRGADGVVDRAVYRLNLSLVEAALTAPDYATRALDRAIEPVDERLLGFDLDDDGVVRAGVTRVRRLPPRYAGAAADQLVVAQAYPRGTELLHSVRYLDPDAPSLMATRMKELRYARKIEAPDDWGLARAYAEADDEKSEGRLPVYQGDPMVGLLSGYGWQLQGFIEDAEGRLRVQSAEEHRSCMGCHGHLGVTIDQSFALPRKVPGADGWRPQDLRGLHDRPQLGHVDAEVLTYVRRVGGGDETRSNDELLARLFPGGTLAEHEVTRTAPGGDRDLAWLLAPSRARALALDKAYLAIVREQSFIHGRDAMLRPATRVHRTIETDGTGLEPRRDARLLLDWR